MVTIGKNQFKNQVLVKTFVQEILLKYPHGCAIDDPVDSLFLRALVALKYEVTENKRIQTFVSWRDDYGYPVLMAKKLGKRELVEIPLEPLFSELES